VNRRTQLIGGLVPAAVALVVWRFWSLHPAIPPKEAPVSTAEPVAAPGPPIDKSETNRTLVVRADW
jgi:hypothetical protein